MAINLLSSYSKQISEAYAKESLVASKLSQNFDFISAKTVTVLTPTTVAMSNYTRSGTNRYGTPAEMEDTKQDLTCTQDKSFALTIDKGNLEDQGNLKQARRMLSLQLRERAIPEMDKYMLGQLVTNAGGSATAALTKSTIVDAVSTGTQALDDAEAPESGRTLFVSAACYKMLRLAPEFLGVDKLGEKSLSKGVIGEYDGMAVVKVPSGRCPANFNFCIVHRDAAVAPVKIDEAHVHQNPPGINGNLLEGRQYYDCFVFTAKNKGVYAHLSA